MQKTGDEHLTLPGCHFLERGRAVPILRVVDDLDRAARALTDNATFEVVANALGCRLGRCNSSRG
jgi:hypothetical protein